MRKDCDTCLHDEFGETYCNDCYWANGKPPTKWEPAPFWTPDTNADRIRAMSDEELAPLVRAVISNESCPMGELDCNDCLFKGACSHVEYWQGREIEWLQLPAEK